MKLTDENKALLLGTTIHTTKVENENDRLLKQKEQFANALWLLLDQKLLEEIKIMVDDIVDDKLRDYDVTDSAYFVDAVHTEISEYDFDDIVDEKLDDQLSAKIAQVISDGEFIFRR